MRRLDLALLAGTLFVCMCSWLAQTSTSRALENPGFATRQLVWLCVGLVVMALFAFADYRVLARFAPLFYAGSLFLLLVVLVAAPVRSGTRAWLPIGPFTVQPSEFARIATILAVAAVAAEHRKDRLSFGVVARLTALVAAPTALVLLEPDLGIALTYLPVLLAALWVCGLPWRAWVALLLAAVAVVGAAWLWYLKPYQRERLLTFADPERAPYGSGYQQRQSRIAVGSGELTGKGLRSGTQSQLRFLPAQHTDFIFAVWAEETGFVGAAALLIAYTLVGLRLFVVAMQARDRLGAVIASTVGTVFAVEVVVNVAMVTGSAPTTGITLPLLSYGGSSILATFIGLGLVHSIWRLRYANV
jgi:rod shape determining protein RodA